MNTDPVADPADTAALWSEPLAEGRPLVLLLHGYASNEADLFSLAGPLAAGIEATAAVDAVIGTESESESDGGLDAAGAALGPARPVFASLRGPHPSDTPFPGAAWFDLRVGRDGALLGAGDTDDDREASASLDDGASSAADHVLAWLDGVLAAGPAPSSLGLVGFSQGGIVSAQLLRMHPSRFQATVLLSSLVAPGLHPGDEALARIRPPLFFGWGGRDPIIPAVATRFSLDWATEATTLTEYAEPAAEHAVTRAQLDAVATFLAAHLT